MKRLNEAGITRGMLFIIIAGVLALLAAAGLFFNQGRRIGIGREFTPSEGPAIINNSESFFRQLSDGEQFEMFRADLAVFARATLSPYKEGEYTDIIFEIENDIRSENETLAFSGSFKENNDTIEATVKKLQNGRIYTTLKNSKSNAGMDSELPSNSSRNQFIGSLPMTKEGYTMAYIRSSESFFVTVTGSDRFTIQQAAQNEIKTKLGDAFRAEEVSYIAWDESGVPKSLQRPAEPDYEITEDDF